MLDYNDRNSYKRCSKKQHTVHMCMPPCGTAIINRLENPEAYGVFGRDYFTMSELKDMQISNPNLYMRFMQYCNAGQIELVSPQKPCVIAGVLGELYCSPLDYVCMNFNFTSGNEAITQDSLIPKLRHSHLDWTQLTFVNTTTKYYAMFIPERDTFKIATSRGTVESVNDPRLCHGKGDFIVVQGIDDTHSVYKRIVVNGLAFKEQFNNKGWEDCLEYREVQSRILPCLFNSPLANNVSSNILKQYEEHAKALSLHIINIFTRFVPVGITHSIIRAKNEEHKSSDRLVADYNCYDFEVMFTLSTSDIIKLNFKYTNSGVASNTYVHIVISDLVNETMLTPISSNYRELGMLLNSINDSVLVEFVRRFVDIQNRGSSAKQRENKLSALFRSWFKG